MKGRQINQSVKNHRPIFLHTQFRSGGTYIWSKFRQCKSYTAYYEPFNEVLAGYQRNSFPAYYQGIRDQMRHADVDEEYFAEYPVDDQGRISGFLEAFSYDQFDLSSGAESLALEAYLNLLIAGAPGRPVMKFCRSALRLDWLARRFNPLSIGVIRNPRDQWQSYNSFAPGYFHAVNMMLTANLSTHTLIAPLAEVMRIPRYKKAGVMEQIEFYQLIVRHLDGHILYAVFYYWWVISLLEFLPRMDLMIDIDLLGQHAEYQHAVDALHLEIDFSDCHSRHYGEYDLNGADFDDIENYIDRVIGQKLSAPFAQADASLIKHNHLAGGSAFACMKRLRSIRDCDRSFHAERNDSATCWDGMLLDAFPACASELSDRIREQSAQLANQEVHITHLENERKNTREYVASLNEHLSRLEYEQSSTYLRLKGLIASLLGRSGK